MGNSSSTIYIPAESPQSVRFDVRGAFLVGAYSFHAAEGRFLIPLGLAVQSVELQDPVALAQTEAVEAVSIPVGSEQRRRLEVEPITGLDTPEVLTQLISGGGIVIGQRKEEGQWAVAGRVDSDLGLLLVYGRVVSDVRMVLRVETRQSTGWFQKSGSFLIARAEGFLGCQVKVRFETETDRQLAKAKATLGFLAATSAAIGVLYLYFFGSRRYRPHWKHFRQR